MDKFKMMGVINVTPDSFSDGGRYDSFDSFVKRMNTLLDWGVDIIDIGAESTAPFNNSVGESEEIERYEQTLLKYIDKFGMPENINLSIDTYRPKTFSYLYSSIKTKWPDVKLIWNDVSGLFDEFLVDFLLQECPDCRYIYCHTTTESREKSSKHMENVLSCSPEMTLEVVKKHFSEVYEKFKEHSLEKRVIFDPAFGFSKTFFQNISLIKYTPDLIKSFSSSVPWILGISRKSFLKKSVDKNSEDSSVVAQTEYLQTHILAKWMEMLDGYNIMVRLHDPAVFSMAIKSNKIFS